MTVEVRIGVRDVPREVSLESDQTPDEVKAIINDAISSGESTITLTDERGRSVVVPTVALGYVEIGPAGKGKVGFGSG